METRVAIISVLGVILAAALSSLATMWVARRQAPALARGADAQWQAQMTEGFRSLTAQYEKANEDLRQELQEVHETVKMQSAKIGQLSGVVTELSAHIEVLEASMKAADIGIPDRPRSGVPGLFVLEGGKNP